MVDMSPDAVTARLREWARLSAGTPLRPRVDMSPEGITARLREMNRLSTFCRQLMAIGAANRKK